MEKKSRNYNKIYIIIGVVALVLIAIMYVNLKKLYMQLPYYGTTYAGETIDDVKVMRGVKASLSDNIVTFEVKCLNFFWL